MCPLDPYFTVILTSQRGNLNAQFPRDAIHIWLQEEQRICHGNNSWFKVSLSEFRWMIRRTDVAGVEIITLGISKLIQSRDAAKRVPSSHR